MSIFYTSLKKQEQLFMRMGHSYRAPRWAYTVLGALFLIGSLGPIVSMRYGIAWRQAQKEKADCKKQEKQARMEARAVH